MGIVTPPTEPAEFAAELAAEFAEVLDPRVKGADRADGMSETDRDTGSTPAAPRTTRPPVRRWAQRADGDRRARARLQISESEGVVLLNDRRIPGSRDSIAMIAVSSAGVFVIDTKGYKGLVHTKRPGQMGALGPHELHVGRRNCTASVEELARQRSVVRAALDTTPWGAEVPVHALLCLTRAEWGFASAVEIGGVWIGWPTLIAGRVQATGVMDSPAVQEVSEMIAEQLPVT